MLIKYCFKLIKNQKNKTILYYQILLYLKIIKKNFNIVSLFFYNAQITPFSKKIIYIYQLNYKFKFYPKTKRLLFILQNNFFVFLLIRNILMQSTIKDQFNLMYKIKNFILFVPHFNWRNFYLYQLFYFNLHCYQIFKEKKLISKYFIYFLKKNSLLQLPTLNKKKYSLQKYLQLKQILNFKKKPKSQPKWEKLSPSRIIKKYKRFYTQCQKKKQFIWFNFHLKQILKKSCLFTISKKNKKTTIQNYKYYKKQLYFFL